MDGSALCHAFAGEGMRVAVADVDAAAAERVAAACGGGARAFGCDVADADAVEALAEAVYAELGACHVLCNNAGVLLFGGIETLTTDDWRWVLSVNLYGVLNGLHAFLPRMRAQGFREASGDFVGVIEDHVIVPPGWARAMLDAMGDEHPVVGGSVENAATDTLLDWACFLCEYSHCIPPIESGEVDWALGESPISIRLPLAASVYLVATWLAKGVTAGEIRSLSRLIMQGPRLRAES